MCLMNVFFCIKVGMHVYIYKISSTNLLVSQDAAHRERDAESLCASVRARVFHAQQSLLLWTLVTH